MVAAFDHIANNYDDSFTNSIVGKAQRKLVWNYLQQSFNHFYDLNVLELNCGTGEDAKWLAEKGAKIIATDISTKMLSIAKKKTVGQNIQFKQLDVLNINETINNNKFNLIFSNFGGLNCISKIQLEYLLLQLQLMLTKNGKIILVIMPTFCLWETLFFLLKLQWHKAFRRLATKPLLAKLNSNSSVQTWYHSVATIKKILPPQLKVSVVKPVGFFIPPSYLNSFFVHRPKLFTWLIKLENKASKLQFLCNIADHYYIEIEQISS